MLKTTKQWVQERVGMWMWIIYKENGKGLRIYDKLLDAKRLLPCGGSWDNLELIKELILDHVALVLAIHLDGNGSLIRIGPNDMGLWLLRRSKKTLVLW